jgi:hypothetical protein
MHSIDETAVELACAKALWLCFSFLYILSPSFTVTAFKFFFFFWWTGVWTQGFALAKQVLYLFSHASSPFCAGCFWRRDLENNSPGLASN